MKQPTQTNKNNTTPLPSKGRETGILTHIKTFFDNVKRTTLRHTEHGRSMTEMLGVLAIVGVLSVGALAGYNLSMNKLRANELIQEMNMRLIALYQQFVKEPDNIDMEMGATTKHGYKISSSLDAVESDVFYLTLNSIPNGVCKQIIGQNWKAPLDAYINDTLIQNGHAAECGTDKTVDMAFKFDKNGSVEDFNNNEDSPENTEPVTVTPQQPETTLSPETTQAPPVDDGCSASAPLMSGYPDGCFSCSHPEGLIAQNCSAICPNRIINRSGWCAIKDCPSGKVHDCSGTCHSCDEPEPWYICFDEEADSCEKVCGRYFDSSGGGGNCYLKRPTP